jgi:hypothetical protein
MEKNEKNRLTVYHPPRKAEQEFLYSGRAPGMTFEQFDECVISWGRAKFGEKYIKGLWRNELIDLNEFDLSDELDKFKMEEHCDLVYQVLLISSPKYADSLVGTAKLELKQGRDFEKSFFASSKQSPLVKQGANFRGEGFSSWATWESISSWDLVLANRKS